mgnify:CR=1 FL=1
MRDADGWRAMRDADGWRAKNEGAGGRSGQEARCSFEPPPAFSISVIKLVCVYSALVMVVTCTKGVLVRYIYTLSLTHS